MVHKVMTLRDFNNISVTQNKVLERVIEDDLVVGMDEGEKRSAWLENWGGERVDRVNRKSVIAMYELGALQGLGGEGRVSYYKVSERYLANKGTK